MQVTLNLEKKYFALILGLVLVLAGGIGVYAFGTNNPPYAGHSVGEIDWTGIIPQLCLSDGCVSTRTSLVGPAGPAGATGATGPQGPQGPAGNNRLSWNDALTRISIDGGGNNAAVSYADRSGNTGAANCQICYRMGLSGCGTVGGPTTTTSEVCASVGSYGTWTDHANGNCIQMKLVCS